MKNYKQFIPLVPSIILLFLLSSHSYSQSIAEIENIAFSHEGTMMIITYDIVKAGTGETFNIGIIITSEAGYTIIPFSIYGDINKDVTSGINKKIIWDMEKDSIPLDEKISIDVVFMKEAPQYIKTAPDSVVSIPEIHRSMDIGFGLGLDYGGIIGIKIEYSPVQHLGIFVSGGIQLSGFGWQVGAIGYLVKKTNTKKVRPYGKFMYGTNASIYVQDMEELNQLYLGPSFGFGIEFRFGPERSHGLNTDLNFPIRSQDYHDDWEALKNNPAIEILSEPLPITFSIGYHFEF